MEPLLKDLPQHEDVQKPENLILLMPIILPNAQ